MIRLAAALLCLAPVALSAQTNPFPDTFSISIFGIEAGGTAKPNGFTFDEIRAVLDSLCTGGDVTDFTRSVLDDGYLVFGAECDAGYSAGPGSVYGTRMDNGAISLELP